LPPERVDRSRVLAAWAGLRVLPRGSGDTAAAPRERLLDVGSRGVVSIAGGKLTTHRRLASEALALLPLEVRPRDLSQRVEPLPGSGSSMTNGALESAVDAVTADHLRSVYGSEAERLLEYSAMPGSFDRIHPDGPDVWAQVSYAVEHEWACTPDDVMLRRTSLAHRGLADSETRAAIFERMATSSRVAARS
jgi:glycerol-3-phosphate dehydrogenase